MNRDKPNILIGTLYSGENEFEECKKSVENQNYTNWEHFVLKDLPNKEAHETLYRRFMSAGDEFDLLIKLDADMVFSKNNVLQKIVNKFKKDNNLDHIVYPVHDFYTDCLIHGMHVFSNRAVWQRSTEEMFVDPSPQIPGKREVLWDSEILVKHSPNPSNSQAFSFGLHRAAKVFQQERDTFAAGQSVYQMRILKYLFKNFCKRSDEKLGCALNGVNAYLKNRASYELYTDKKELINNFKNEEDNWVVKKINFSYLIYVMFRQNKLNALKVITLLLIQTVTMSSQDKIRPHQ